MGWITSTRSSRRRTGVGLCGSLALVVLLVFAASDCVVAEVPAQVPVPPQVPERAPDVAAPAKAPRARAEARAKAESTSEREKSGPSSEQSTRSAEKLGLDLSSDAPLEIDSRLIDIVDADGGGERIRFSGGVTLKQGDLQLTCSVLDAFYPDGAQGRPERIVADGDVVVVQGDMELRCTRAEFDDSKCRTVCLSSEACGSEAWPEQPALLKRGDNSIAGRQLEFDLCTSRLSGSCGARVVLNPERDQDRKAAPQAGEGPGPSEAPDLAPSEAQAPDLDTNGSAPAADGSRREAKGP